MNTDTLNKAISEAKRFIKAAERVEFDRWGFGNCKETAAAKRASMDLTRALAELRKL